MTLTFGSSLRYLRKRKHLTLQQVADEMGVSYPSVQQWETDKTIPHISRCADLSKILGASLGGMWPRPEADVGVDYSEELVKLCIEDFEELDNYEREGERLGRDPFHYALSERAKNRIRQRVSYSFSRNEDPNLHDLIKIYRTDVTSNGNSFDVVSEAAGYVTKPTALSIIKMPFCIYNPNSSMSPKYEKGDLLVFDDIPVTNYSGYCLIGSLDRGNKRLSDCRLVRLVAIMPDQYIALQLNPIEHVVIPRQEDIHAYRILTMSDVLEDVTPPALKERLR